MCAFYSRYFGQQDSENDGEITLTFNDIAFTTFTGEAILYLDLSKDPYIFKGQKGHIQVESDYVQTLHVISA